MPEAMFPMSPNPSQTTGTRRQQQKAETRLLILNSARTLFEKTGYERTTIRTVASHAGVGLGTIFTHFPDKAALLAAALHDNLETAITQALNTVPHEAGVREQLIHIASALYTHYGKNPELGRILIKNILFVTGPSRQAMDEMETRFFTMASQLISDGKTTGEIRDDADSDLAAENFFAHYIYVLLMELSKPVFDPRFATERLQLFLNQTFIGIDASAGAPAP
jgi:AcrR family transcriptional regulator